MKYVIHHHNFSYQDDFYFKDSRTLSSIEHFSNEAEAKRAWVTLEKESVAIHEKEPFQMLSYSNGGYYENKRNKIVAMIKSWGYEVDARLNNKESSLHVNDLKLKQLTDEQYLELIIALDCNEYVLQKYDDNPTVFVMFFAENKLSYFQGYLSPYYSEYGGIVEKNTIQALFDEESFYEECTYEPIVTYFNEVDKKNSLVQSVLKQYVEAFHLFEEHIYFLQPNREIESCKHCIEGLKAMNAVLSHPFFEIRELTVEELLDIEKADDERIGKEMRGIIESHEYEPLPSYERFLDYLHSKSHV